VDHYGTPTLHGHVTGHSQSINNMGLDISQDLLHSVTGQKIRKFEFLGSSFAPDSLLKTNDRIHPRWLERIIVAFGLPVQTYYF